MGRGVRLLRAAAGISLGLLGGGLLRWLGPRPDRPLMAPEDPSYQTAYWATAFGSALLQAKGFRRYAYRESGLERYSVGLPWPEVVESPESDVRGRVLLARDAAGNLRRAREVAREALGWARTLPERYEATLLLARLECEAGRHAEELRLARKLVALQPGSSDARRMLQRARRCNRAQTPEEPARIEADTP